MKHKCPVCHKAVKAPSQDQAEGIEFFPFCSRQCKLIDLGAWLDARYMIISGSVSGESAELSDSSQDRRSDKL